MVTLGLFTNLLPGVGLAANKLNSYRPSQTHTGLLTNTKPALAIGVVREMLTTMEGLDSKVNQDILAIKSSKDQSEVTKVNMKGL